MDVGDEPGSDAEGRFLDARGILEICTSIVIATETDVQDGDMIPGTEDATGVLLLQGTCFICLFSFCSSTGL